MAFEGLRHLDLLEDFGAEEVGGDEHETTSARWVAA